MRRTSADSSLYALASCHSGRGDHLLPLPTVVCSLGDLKAMKNALEATDARGLQAISIALRRGVRSAASALVRCGVMPVEALAGAPRRRRSAILVPPLFWCPNCLLEATEPPGLRTPPRASVLVSGGSLGIDRAFAKELLSEAIKVRSWRGC